MSITSWDIIICLLLLAGMATGFGRGMASQLAHALSVYVGLAVAAQYTSLVLTALASQLAIWPSYVSGAIVFLAILAAVTVALDLVFNTLTSSKTRSVPGNVSRVVGLLLGGIIMVATLAAIAPVLRYGIAGSWGRNEALRNAITDALNNSYLMPLLERITPTVLAAINPLLPGGLPIMLQGKLT